MRQVLKYLILLYPKPWRNRYANEFDALLNAVPPTRLTLIDVLNGAIKMQLKSGKLWKAAAAAALAALLASVTFSFYPSGYRSEAVIRPQEEAQLNEQTVKILSTTSLVSLIQRENLYEKERATVPVDELALGLRTSTLLWSDRKDGPLRVRVTAPDAAQAQRAAQGIADAFVDAKAAALVDPANLPAHPERPPFRPVLQLGLVVGLLAGGLFALFNGLRVWKLVGALGVGGTILGLAAGSVIPNIFQGLSIVSCRTSDAAAVGRLIDSATDTERLASMVRQFNLYSGDPRAEQKLREHLTLRPDLRPSGNPLTGTTQSSYDIVITFQYPNQATAQVVTEAVAAYLADQNVQRRSGITVEVVAPAFVHQGAPVPNRVIGSGTGFVLGLACAVILGIWRVSSSRRQLRHA